MYIQGITTQLKLPPHYNYENNCSYRNKYEIYLYISEMYKILIS